MARERTGEQFDSWLNHVETSQLPAFHTFGTRVRKDKDAVLAGLTHPWSTGPVEGQVNLGIGSSNSCRVWSSPV
jgi:transposase